MKFYEEKAKSLPVADEVDVLVLGAGPAGFSAAVCAAREGAKVMLIEQTGNVGGIATEGLMSHWTGNTKGGFYDEIISNSCDLSGGGASDSKLTINPEKLKTYMLNTLVKEGVIVKLYTFASDAIMEENVIKGAIIESKSGREAVMAKIVIDSSGDGDIAAKSGAEYFKGRESDGLMQPMTIMFKIAGVDTDKTIFPGGFESYTDVPKGEVQALGKKILKSPAGHVLIYKTTLPGIVTINMTNCTYVDGTNVDDLTKATYVCRNQMNEIHDFLKEYVPGFENSYIISSSSLMGVRETRHFKGEKTITEKDISEARVFEDWAVTKAHFNFDVHNLTGSGLDETGSQKTFKQRNGYTIPYGCFIPLKIENLMLAGRNISGTHMAHSNYRVMPICANMGQSVAVAAVMSIKEGIYPRNLGVKKLQARLTELGIEP